MNPTENPEGKDLGPKTPALSVQNTDELSEEQLERLSGGAMSSHTEV